MLSTAELHKWLPLKYRLQQMNDQKGYSRSLEKWFYSTGYIYTTFTAYATLSDFTKSFSFKVTFQITSYCLSFNKPQNFHCLCLVPFQRQCHLFTKIYRCHVTLNTSQSGIIYDAYVSTRHGQSAHQNWRA